MAEIRSDVNQKYATKIDTGEIEQKFVRFYISKFSRKHTPKSFLAEGEKKRIKIKSVRNMAAKSGSLELIKKFSQPWKRDIIKCVHDNLALIRSEVNPKYGAELDNGIIERKFVYFYSSRFSGNHTLESVLTEEEKKTIFQTVQGLAVKNEKH